MALFHYTSGHIIIAGDLITVAGQEGFVEQIFTPGTTAAADYACAKTGGILLHFTNGDLQMWSWPDEDLELIRRGGVTPHL